MKKRETLKSLRRQIRWLQDDIKQREARFYSRGYNDGRQHVTNAFRDLLGINKL